MKRDRLIWVIIFIVGFSVRCTDLFHPVDTESWREADDSTIALNFYKNGTNIFHPQIAWDGNGPGYTESEFQIYPYLMKISYKIFGFWEPTGRVISFLFSLATMLVFFRFSSYLLSLKSAMIASFFFALSPILTVISVAIRPESVMFFFYLCSAYTFIRWLDSQSKSYYWLAIFFTALALLSKITAGNIGILFLILILFKKGWKFLLKPKVLILGALSIIPSILWYSYGRQFYVLYGNSLGLSNEHSWIGWDFFTNRHFIINLIANELSNVWLTPGLLIVILALASTKLIKKESTFLVICWLAAVFFSYIITIRTTSQSWAYYYHIFSIPAASILLGTSVVELYEKYSPGLYFTRKIVMHRAAIVKSSIIILFLLLFLSYYLVSAFNYQTKTKEAIFQTYEVYACKDSLKKLIPPQSLLLANGSYIKGAAGYPLAYNNSYLFYWLNCKGYNIGIEDLSIKNILLFKSRGCAFFLAETKFCKPELKNELKKKFTPIFECNGNILFKL